MDKIEFHQILAAPNCRDYDNLTFLEEKKMCEKKVNIYGEKTFHVEQDETNLPLEFLDGTDFYIFRHIPERLPQF